VTPSRARSPLAGRLSAERVAPNSVELRRKGASVVLVRSKSPPKVELRPRLSASGASAGEGIGDSGSGGDDARAAAFASVRGAFQQVDRVEVTVDAAARRTHGSGDRGGGGGVLPSQVRLRASRWDAAALMPPWCTPALGR
jgi:hypothetical protein